MSDTETDKNRRLLGELQRLNERAGLVISDGENEPFWVVKRVGWHQPTEQIVLERGIRIGADTLDAEVREPVQW